MQFYLNGASGRMGQAILAEVSAEAMVQQLENCDVVIDFSVHEATLPLVRESARHKKPVVIGTTGHERAEREAITRFSREIPIVWASNFSIGINLLQHLTAEAAKVLHKNFDPEIIEMHHRKKKDAPSGTAQQLKELLCSIYSIEEKRVVYGRKGLSCERENKPPEIGVHAIRGGDIVGEHTVIFAGEGERIELIHKASDRRIFARGALRAAHWVHGRAPGLYGMKDVLELT